MSKNENLGVKFSEKIEGEHNAAKPIFLIQKVSA
jgi:hypothetical protein